MYDKQNGLRKEIMKSQGEGYRPAAGQARAHSCSTRVTLLLPDARSYVTCHNSSQAFPYIRVVGRATASSHVCSFLLRFVLNMRVFLARRLRALATSPTPPSAGPCAATASPITSLRTISLVLVVSGVRGTARLRIQPPHVLCGTGRCDSE